jgi:predicted RNase H-like HicB family nuclease
MANKYSFNIEWSEEDQEYLATCPSFPGLTAFGETEEEALAEGKIALQGFIQTCEANNIPLPEPSVKGTFSGKFQLRLPKALHGLAVRMAEIEDVSLNVYIADAVRARVSGEQVAKSVIEEMRRQFEKTQVALASAMPVQTRYTEKETVKETEGTISLVTSGSDIHKGH